jgi:Na+/melibiose symporter-like transporter
MRDRFHGIDLAKAASILTIVGAMTPPLAPIAGGYLQALAGWRTSFFVLIIMGIAALFAYSKFFEESLAKEKRQPLSLKHILKGYLSCITHRRFLLFAMSSSMCVAVMMGFVTMGAFIFQHQLGLTAIQYGWISVVSAVSMPVGAYLTNRLVKRLGQFKLIIVGGIIISTAALAMLIIGLMGVINMWVILLPMSFIFAGMGFIFPTAFSIAFADFGHIAGIAGAMYGGVQLLGAAIATGIAAHLPLENQVPMAGYLLGCGSIILLAMFVSKSLSTAHSIP